MSLISRVGLVDGQIVYAEHPNRIIDALSAVSNTDILIWGDLQVTGSSILYGNVKLYGGSLYLTSSLYTIPLTLNSGAYEILVRDFSTGLIGYRDVATISGSGGSSSPGGNNYAVQFNSGSTLSGSDLLTWNYTNNVLGINDTQIRGVSQNTFVGSGSGEVNVGSSNSGFGYKSLFINTSGSGNVALGSFALSSNITGNDNTSLGYLALMDNKNHNNVAIGSNALRFNIIGSGSVAIGYRAGYYNNLSNTLWIANSETIQPLIYGNFSTNRLGINKPTGSLNATLDISGSVIISGSLNVSSSLTGSIISASQFTGSFFGTSSVSIESISSSYPILVIGPPNQRSIISSVGPFNYSLENISSSVAIGYQVNIGSGSQNIVIGYGAGSISSSNNTLIGANAGGNSEKSNYNTVIGSSTFAGSPTSSDNFVAGNSALSNSPKSYNNVVIGYAAMSNSPSSSHNVGMGYLAMAISPTSSHNITIGYQAGYFARGKNNVIYLGENTGNATSGSYNIYLGYKLGQSSTGSNNIIIGTNMSLPSPTSNFVNIGGIIFASGSYSTVSGNAFTGSMMGKVGINVSNPQYNLDVSGSVNFRNGLTVSGSVTGSLLGTASFALTSSFAQNVPFVSTNFDGQGNIVLVGTKTYFRVHTSRTPVSYSIVAEGTVPTCSLDIYVTGSGISLPTISNSIVNNQFATLSLGNVVNSSIPSVWTSSFSIGDIVCINIVSSSNATKINFILY